MHLAIHPARFGVPAHSQALLTHLGQIQARPPRGCCQRFQIHQPEAHMYLPPDPAYPKAPRHIPKEAKFADMRARQEKLREKGIIA